MSDGPLVLVCGSRDWHRSDVIEERLAKLPRGAVVMHGGARGADRMAASVAAGLGLQVREYAALWHPNGGYDPKAGLQRNLRMLDQEPELVIAFWRNGSTGTGHTVHEARKRGITVEVIAA